MKLPLTALSAPLQAGVSTVTVIDMRDQECWVMAEYQTTKLKVTDIPFVNQVKYSRSSSETHGNSSENMHVTEIQVKHRKFKRNKFKYPY